MSRRITWQNVNAPNFSGVSEALRLGTVAMDRGFSGLADTVAKFRTNRENAAAAEVLNRSMDFQDPAALRAAIANGEVFQGVNRGHLSPAGLAALDNRAGTLLTQTTAQQNLTQDAELHPLRVDSARNTVRTQNQTFGQNELMNPRRVEEADLEIAGRRIQNNNSQRTGELREEEFGWRRDDRHTAQGDRADQEAGTAAAQIALARGGPNAREDALAEIVGLPAEAISPRARAHALALLQGTASPAAGSRPVGRPPGSGTAPAAAAVAPAARAPTTNTGTGTSRSTGNRAGGEPAGSGSLVAGLTNLARPMPSSPDVMYGTNAPVLAARDARGGTSEFSRERYASVPDRPPEGSTFRRPESGPATRIVRGRVEQNPWAGLNNLPAPSGRIGAPTSGTVVMPPVPAGSSSVVNPRSVSPRAGEPELVPMGGSRSAPLVMVPESPGPRSNREYPGGDVRPAFVAQADENSPAGPQADPIVEIQRSTDAAQELLINLVDRQLQIADNQGLRNFEAQETNNEDAETISRRLGATGGTLSDYGPQRIFQGIRRIQSMVPGIRDAEAARILMAANDGAGGGMLWRMLYSGVPVNEDRLRTEINAVQRNTRSSTVNSVREVTQLGEALRTSTEAATQAAALLAQARAGRNVSPENIARYEQAARLAHARMQADLARVAALPATARVRETPPEPGQARNGNRVGNGGGW